MSASSSSSLSRLLSQTKISTFDPRLPQVYTSPKAYADRGDWGFSKPIPIRLANGKRLQYLTLSNLETQSGHVDWRSNESRSRFLKRFKENPIMFSNGTNDNRSSTSSYKDLSTPSSSSTSSPGSLGPRPRSIFDKHSYRPLPIESLPTPALNEHLSDQERLRLQSKRNSSRSGFGYLYSETGDLREVKGTASDPLGENSDYFSNHSNLFPNYNLMSEKRFENFIEKLRLDEHGLQVSKSTSSPSSSGEEQSLNLDGQGQRKVGNYRKELEKKEMIKRRDLLNRIKERFRSQAITVVAAARETGSTPSPDALFYSSFNTPQEIPDQELLKRSNGELDELMAGVIQRDESKGEASSQEEGGKSLSSSGIEIDLWNESRKINTFNSADYLRKTLSFLESCDPNSTKLPTSSLVGSNHKSNTTGTRHSRDGLQYSNPDKIFTSRLSEPIKGRVLNDQSKNRNQNRARDQVSNLTVGLNGMVSELTKKDSEALQPMNYEEALLDQAIGKFRMVADATSSRESEILGDETYFNSNTSSSSSSTRGREFTLPSLIRSRVRSTRESDPNKKTPNDIIPGSKSWLIHLKPSTNENTSQSSSSTAKFHLDTDYFNNAPRRYQRGSGRNLDGNGSRRTPSGGSNQTASGLNGTGFPYSQSENQIKIDRDTAAQRRRMERDSKGEENHQKAEKTKKELSNSLSQLNL